MDIYTLVAPNIHSGTRPNLKDANWENRYYSEQVTFLRLHPGLLGPIVVCALLILVGTPAIW